MAKHILVMDDEPYMLASIKEVLEKEGYRVSGFGTGQKTIDALKSRKFDLVILDVMMPDISGWDVFNHIRQTNSKQKVIFVSVLAISPERKKELETYGPAEYITKPFDREILVNRVKMILTDKKKM